MDFVQQAVILILTFRGCLCASVCVKRVYACGDRSGLERAPEARKDYFLKAYG